MKKTTFYVIEVRDGDKGIVALDYPRYLPLPNIGESLTIQNKNKETHGGVITKRSFTVSESYNEIKLVLQTR